VYRGLTSYKQEVKVLWFRKGQDRGKTKEKRGIFEARQSLLLIILLDGECFGRLEWRLRGPSEVLLLLLPPCCVEMECHHSFIIHGLVREQDCSHGIVVVGIEKAKAQGHPWRHHVEST
jgi:hypothetical protein